MKDKMRFISVFLVVTLSLIGSFFISHVLLSDAVFRISEMNFIKINPSKLKMILFVDKLKMILFVAYSILFAVGVHLIFSKNRTLSTKKHSYTKDLELPEKVGDNQYGSAGFMSKAEIEDYFSEYEVDMAKSPYSKLLLNEALEPQEAKVLPRGGIVVGMEKKGPKERIKYISNTSHLICIGGTGTGKTRRVVLQSILTLMLGGESIVVSDPKGEIFDYTEEFAKKLGYQVSVLNFKNPEHSMSYNPLQPIIDAIFYGNIDDAINKTWDLTKILVGEGGKNTEKVWTNGEMAVIGASILCVCYDYMKKPEYQTLSFVYVFMSEMCKEVSIGMISTTPFSEYIKTLADTHPAKNILAIADIAPEKMKGSFFTSALTTLRLFSAKSIYNITKNSNISLSDMGDRKEILYIILPDEKTAFYQIASLIISQQYEALVNKADSEGGTLKVRVNNILDEFGNFAPISDIEAKLTAARSRGIRYIMFIQEFAQLERKYSKEVAKIIRGNCENMIYLWSSDNETREEISKGLGTYTVSSFSKSQSKQSYSSNSSVSQNYIQRSLLTAEELGRLDKPYQLILTRKRPVILKAEGLEKWHFNTLLGLGTEEENTAFRKKRFEERENLKHIDEEIRIDRKGIDKWKNEANRVVTQKAMKLMR